MRGHWLSGFSLLGLRLRSRLGETDTLLFAFGHDVGYESNELLGFQGMMFYVLSRLHALFLFFSVRVGCYAFDLALISLCI